jgi:hypothetical protein
MRRRIGHPDKSEPEALAEFGRRTKNWLAPQAHGNEN